MSRNRHRATKFLVDVVITTGGRWDLLPQCLEAVRKQTLPCNIILIDHNCDAQERRQNESLFAGVSTKRLMRDVGYPAANNEGARMGGAPLILFLNDDCILEAEAVEQMVRTMDNPSVGIVGAKLTFPLTSTHPNRPAGKVQHVGLALNIRGEVIHPLISWSPDNPKTCVTREVWGVTGACLLIRRRLFSKLNGFDTVFGMGTYEDADLCLKARSSGYRIVLNAEARGTHYAGATAEKKQVAYPLQYNSMLFKSKWLNSPLMAWGTPDPNSWVGEANFW